VGAGVLRGRRQRAAGGVRGAARSRAEGEPLSVVDAAVLHVILSTASCAFSMTRDTSTISFFTSFSAASSLVHCACIDVPSILPRAQHERLRGGISSPKSKQSLKRVSSSRSLSPDGASDASPGPHTGARLKVRTHLPKPGGSRWAVTRSARRPSASASGASSMLVEPILWNRHRDLARLRLKEHSERDDRAAAEASQQPENQKQADQTRHRCVLKIRGPTTLDPVSSTIIFQRP